MSDGVHNVSSTVGTTVQTIPTVTNIILLPGQVDTDTTPTVFWNYTCSGTPHFQINWYVGGASVQG